MIGISECRDLNSLSGGHGHWFPWMHIVCMKVLLHAWNVADPLDLWHQRQRWNTLSFTTTKTWHHGYHIGSSLWTTQMVWPCTTGHVLYQIFQIFPNPGTKKKRRPRKTWSECVNTDVNGCGLAGVDKLHKDASRADVRHSLVLRRTVRIIRMKFHLKVLVCVSYELRMKYIWKSWPLRYFTHNYIWISYEVHMNFTWNTYVAETFYSYELHKNFIRTSYEFRRKYTRIIR